MATNLNPIYRFALPAAVMLGLVGCAECPKDTGLTNNDYQVGRYQIVQLAASDEVLEIDTANGKTWRLAGNDPENRGQSLAWRPIEDLN